MRTALVPRFLAFLAAALLLAPGSGLRAQAPNVPDLPVLLSADQVTYDENLEVVTASGNVEIAQEDRVLLADSISYNLRAEVVTASGNITLLEPTGEVLFAQYVELTDDLKEGVIKDFKVLLTDRSRLAAASGVRVGGNKSALRKAVYSPCELCAEDPTKAPLWQIKADRIVHDQEEKTIAYEDATFELFGLPVAYTPYFEHPDPTVKRKSGFLSPTVGGSGSLGTTFQLPYFWAISEDKDLTIEPIFTTKQSVVAAGQYRQLLRQGSLDIGGSATIADRDRGDGTIDENDFRGHIDATGRFDINDTWRWGFDLNRATDDTYLRLYNFSNDRTLTTAAFAEGFRGRTYMSVNNYLYQGLRDNDDLATTPLILPKLDYNFVGEPGEAGGVYSFDLNMQAIHREDGRESRRISAIGGWELPFTSPIGDIYRLRASVEADGYWVDDFDPQLPATVDPGATGDEFLTGRVFPQLSLLWRYPWVSNLDGWTQMIEPVVQGVAAPSTAMNPGEIPNEDSLGFEFDDTNLFSLNRFPGLDRVDPGSRVDYGLKWNVVTPGGLTSSAFVGQSYRLKEDENFRPGSGLEDNLSDFVGRLTLNPSDYIDLSYRFRLDKEDLDRQRSELDVLLGPPALNLQLNYLDTGVVQSGDDVAGREELTVAVRSKLSEYWSAFVAHRRNLLTDDSLSTEAGVSYQDECFLIDVIAQRSFFSDREIEPEDSIFLRIGLKHLGQFGTS